MQLQKYCTNVIKLFLKKGDYIYFKKLFCSLDPIIANTLALAKRDITCSTFKIIIHLDEVPPFSN